MKLNYRAILFPILSAHKHRAIQRDHRAYAILRHFVTANPNRTTNAKESP